MGVLEEVMQMKEQGIPEQEIVKRLQERGVSPKEVNDALNQAQIKSAVSEGMEDPDQQFPSLPSKPSSNQPQYTPRTQETRNFPEQELYTPQPQEEYPQEEYYPQSQEGYPQEEYPQQEYYPQEGYGEYPSPGGGYTDNVIEIAEQVFSEKIQKIQKQVDEINEFKTLAQTKIDTIAEKLKRIETTIDKLQIAILDRIGSYGKNLDSIKKEMSMMQDSFGKVVNQALKKSTASTPKKTGSSTKRKTKKK